MKMDIRKIFKLKLGIISWQIIGTLFAFSFITIAEEISMKHIARENNSFVLDLYKQLKSEKGNLFFSPYSISTALAMTYAGARGNTEKQMSEVMHFSQDQKEFHKAFSELQKHLNDIQEKGEIELNIANSLWLHNNYKFRKEYFSLVKQHYGSVFNTVDFTKTEAARKQINEWVEEETNEKIKELIKPGILDRLTRLVLTNAIYFKGNWYYQFKKSSTKDMPFYTLPEKSTDVPMMYQKENFGYYKNSSCQILELPYKGNDLSMIIFLPDKKDGLSGLENQLNTEKLNKWTGELSNTKVKVYLPKFTMCSSFELGKTLADMGMAEAFSNIANFSGIADKLKISEVVHKAFIEVNEKGTEAAAATAVAMRCYAAPPGEIPVFRADHPFVFIIKDVRTGSILFFGRLVSP